MVIMDVTIVNVALPSMAKALQGSTSWLQWVIDGYTLTFACLLLSSGNLGDRIGARSVYLAGLVLFVLTSLLCGLSSDFLQLTVFRLLQGIGAALLVPASLSLINSSYENKAERAKAIAIWGAISATGAALGPILGGMLTFYFGWRSIFFVNVPIGLIAFFLTRYYVINPAPNGKGHFDLLGQILGVISIAALAFALIEAGRWGWFSHPVMTAFFIFIATFIIFLWVELKSTAPMFPLQFFRSRIFSSAILVGMVMNMGWYGVMFVLTLYFQHVRHYSVLMTGFAFIPFVGMNAIGAFLGGKLTNRVGPKWTMLTGLLIGTAGFFSLLIANEYTPYILLILPLFATGVGIAVSMPAATVSIIHSVPAGRVGVASGALNASRQVGSLIGVAIFGTMITLSKYFIIGMHETLLMGGLLYLCGAIAVLWFPEKGV